MKCTKHTILLILERLNSYKNLVIFDHINVEINISFHSQRKCKEPRAAHQFVESITINYSFYDGQKHGGEMHANCRLQKHVPLKGATGLQLFV